MALKAEPIAGGVKHLSGMREAREVLREIETADRHAAAVWVCSVVPGTATPEQIADYEQQRRDASVALQLSMERAKEWLDQFLDLINQPQEERTDVN